MKFLVEEGWRTVSINVIVISILLTMRLLTKKAWWLVFTALVINLSMCKHTHSFQ